MKVKHIINTSLMCATAAMLSTSCTFEQEDYFDESASLRITHLNEDIQSRLVNQSTGENNGWVIQYFVAGTDEMDFEGFNLFGRFYKNNTVTLASNHRYLRNGNANKYTEHTSHYEMLAEEGPVLSFNTWNDILTVFEDPVSPSSAPGRIEQDGVGMNGDHNLVLKSYNENEIVFRGERHSALVRFVPCDRSFEEYIAAVNEFKSKYTSTTLNNYYVTNGTDTMYFAGLNKGLFGYYDRINDPLKRKTLSCVFTPNGFLLNRVDSLGSQTFQEFTIAEDRTKLLSEDGQTQVIACWDSYVAECPSDWRLDPNKFTAEQTNLYQKMEAEVQKVSGWKLDSLCIGNKTETKTDGTKVNYHALLAYAHGPARMGRVPIIKPYIYIDFGKAAFGEMTISQSSETKTSDDMATFAETDLKNLCEQFAATIYGRYYIEPNDLFRPTYADLIPVNTGNPIGLRLKKIVD